MTRPNLWLARKTGGELVTLYKHLRMASGRRIPPGRPPSSPAGRSCGEKPLSLLVSVSIGRGLVEESDGFFLEELEIASAVLQDLVDGLFV